MKKRVADILVETLIELGIKDCFCVVGGGAMHINNAFHNNNSIDVTYCHHEQACSFAAEGYAKYSGKVAVVSVTSGPGAVNSLNGVYSAYVDSTPLIVIAGHPRYDTTAQACGLKLRCRGVQEYDIIPTVKGMTKYAKMILDPLDIRKEVIKAYKIAVDGRRGPVWLTVPLDVQSALVETSELHRCEEVLENNKNSGVVDKINNIIQMLKNAEKPVLLFGSAIRSADVRNEFLELVKKIDIPIVGEPVVSDLLPKGYKNFYGFSGNIGPRVGNYILQESDLILILGNSMSTRQTGFNQELFAPGARLIMIDIDQDELLKPGLNIEFPVQMDIKLFIDTMNDTINDKIVCSKSWNLFCDKVYNKFSQYDIPPIPADGTIPQKVFWNMFLDKIEDDALIALGNSSCVTGVFQLGTRKLNQRVITNCNAGSMGYDLPEACGIAKASGKSVYCVTGDGSIMMNLQELQTIKYNDFKIKIVLFSNNGYGAIRQTCKNYFNGVYAGCDEKSGVDFPSFENIACTFDFLYVKCESYSELDKTLNDFVKYDGRCILEIKEDINDAVIPKIMSRMKDDGTFETPSFIDLFPFISEDDEKILEKYREELYNGLSDTSF